MLAAFDANAKKQAEILKVYKKICKAKVKAAYKCDLLIKAFPAPKAKKVAKKTAVKSKTKADVKAKENGKKKEKKTKK